MQKIINNIESAIKSGKAKVREYEWFCNNCYQHCTDLIPSWTNNGKHEDLVCPTCKTNDGLEEICYTDKGGD